MWWSKIAAIRARAAVANELSQRSGFADTEEAMEYYGKLSNDALRILAGLPGNEVAFSQLTIQPLDPEEIDPDDPPKRKWRDRAD